MKRYIVIIEHPPMPAPVKACGDSAVAHWAEAACRDRLAIVKNHIVQRIFADYGGHLINELMARSQRKGAEDRHDVMLIIEATPTAADKISNMDYVENIVDNLEASCLRHAPPLKMIPHVR